MAFKENEIVAKQEEVCLKYGADFLSAPFNSIIGVALDTFTEESKPVNGLRHPSGSPNGNGWYIWAGEYSSDTDFFKPVHINHLLEIYPQALKYLGLAPGWRFLLGDNNYEDVWFDADLLNI